MGFRAWAGGLVVTGGVAGGLIISGVIGGGGGGVTCSSTATTAAQIDSQLSAASGGQTICVTANTTASHTWNFSKASDVTILAQPENQTIPMGSIDFGDADHIKVDGFNFANAGTSVNSPSTATFLTLRKNLFHDGNSIALNLNGSGTNTHDISFIGNTVSRISCNSQLTVPNSGVCVFGGGYAIYGCGGCHDLLVAYNTLDVGGPDSAPVKSADNIELGDVHNSTFIGNIVTHTRNIEEVCNGCTGDADGHADSWLFWAGSTNLTFTDNRVVDGTDWGITGDSSDISITNNLVANQSAQACMDINYTNPPVRMTVTRTTVWQCPGGVWACPGGSGTGNTADHNLAQQSPGCGTWSANNFNVMGGGLNNWTGASNLANTTPTWANTTDPTSQSYYIPTSLAGNFATSGYRYAPAGAAEIQPGY